MHIHDLTILDNFNMMLESIRKKGFARKNEDIVEKTGYNKTTVSNYLNGKRPLSIEFIKSFIDAYKIDRRKIYK